MSRGKKIGLGALAAVLALIVLGSLGDSDTNKTSSSTSESRTTTETSAVAPTTTETSAVAPTTTETSAVAPTTTEPPKPDFTPAQANAIAKAENYLGYTAFSKQGLISQLEYDQFSTADATFAVEHIEANGGVDWNEQAVKKAKDYLEFTSFSLPGLIDQLKYDGFTQSEAQYGAEAAYG